MAIETLRPNAAGDETSIQNQFPVTGAHWDKVDDDPADEDSTYVYPDEVDSFFRDLYHLPASTGSGTINKITVFFRCKDQSDAGFCGAKASIKSNGTVTDGESRTTTTSYVTYSKEWAVNPADAGAWEWADIDALQIGVSLQADSGLSPGYYTWCTQVYVEVDYTPVVGTNMKINISDVFKDIESLKINIGNVWKDVVQIQQNIGDVWKNVFG